MTSPILPDQIRLQFLGASGTVTGSRYLLETSRYKLLVDCGQFQGLKALRERNREHFPVKPSSIQAVLLTHGHLDHCGWLPVLVKQGFKGPIYCSEPTRAVASLILRDSGKIQEEEAERANHNGWTRHKPAEPLFTLEDAERCLKHFETIETHDWHGLLPGMKARWRPNAHILGSCSIEILNENPHKTLVFSGDVGRADDQLLFPPEKPAHADVLLLESTYGDRLHPQSDPLAQLHQSISQTLLRGGTLLIPGFAVERLQLLLWLLNQLKDQGVLPKVPMLFDSPMGTAMLELFHRFRAWHRLDEDALDVLTSRIQVIEDSQDSQTWAANKAPKIVLAGSGMLTGGRIMNYLWHELGNPDSTILLSGYQAEGTRGRSLLTGASEVKMQGQWLPVRARIQNLEGLSAHADQAGLLDWLSELDTPPQDLFLVHGEPDSAKTLRSELQSRYGWEAHIAQDREARWL